MAVSVEACPTILKIASYMSKVSAFPGLGPVRGDISEWSVDRL
jgi:hypothetical protein